MRLDKLWARVSKVKCIVPRSARLTDVDQYARGKNTRFENLQCTALLESEEFRNLLGSSSFARTAFLLNKKALA